MNRPLHRDNDTEKRGMEQVPGINEIECPAAEQLEDAMAHLSQLHLILGIHALRLRSTEWERQRKAAQRARRHPIERDDAPERTLRSA